MNIFEYNRKTRRALKGKVLSRPRYEVDMTTILGTDDEKSTVTVLAATDLGSLELIFPRGEAERLAASILVASTKIGKTKRTA